MSESQFYKQVFDYLSGDYPEGTNKAEKRLIRKKSASFRLIEGELYFVGKNGKNEDGPRRWVPNEEEQRRIIVSCHSDKLAGHFGRDKTRDKVSLLNFTLVHSL